MEITYCIIKNHNLPKQDMIKFKKQVKSVLSTIPKVTYKETCCKCADIHVILEKQDIVNKVIGSDEKFSWTDQRANVIMFSYENWKNNTLHNSHKTYQEYVILHEFFHAYPFYKNHDTTSCNSNGKYNIMYQQTRNADQGEICDKVEFDFGSLDTFDKPKNMKKFKQKLLQDYLNVQK